MWGLLYLFFKQLMDGLIFRIIYFGIIPFYENLLLLLLLEEEVMLGGSSF